MFDAFGNNKKKKRKRDDLYCCVDFVIFCYFSHSRQSAYIISVV